MYVSLYIWIKVTKEFVKYCKSYEKVNIVERFLVCEAWGLVEIAFFLYRFYCMF